MRKTLFTMLMLGLGLTALAQQGVKGVLVDARTGRPVADATVMLQDQALMVTSGNDGVFTISNAQVGTDVLEIIAYEYSDAYVDVDIKSGMMSDLGEIKLSKSGFVAPELDSADVFFDETQVMDESDVSQSVGTIQGAVDDVYYQAANYNFSTARFRLRGYSDDWTEGYINGINYNDAMRGKFNYSGLGGMTSSAFRNKTVDVGLAAAAYGFGSVGGASNFTTYASQYAPGFRGNVSYTNSNYMLRAMLQYNTGLMKDGWAVSASIIGRYAPQNVSPIPGTWYNSFGYAVSVEKIFNDKHRLNLTTWGAPTQRASNAWTTKEAYDLAHNNLYNPMWGYQNGKKRSAKVVSTFDPSVILNWIWNPQMGTTLNTAVAYRHNEYGQTGLGWYNAPDPRADYYHKLPSDHMPTAEPGTSQYEAQLAEYNQYLEAWQDEAYRQINWDAMYQTNYLNNIYLESDPSQTGRASYIVEESHNDFDAVMLNSYLDHRINDVMTVQGGLSFNYTNGHYYKTLRDLLGGQFWLDIDSWTETKFPGTNVLQNDLNNPDRRVKEGEVFGYDYNMLSYKGHGWAQAQIRTNHWDINFGGEINYVNFWRDGNMRNGRAEMLGVTSYGAGDHHGYLTGAGKIGVTYKINGRNYLVAHVGGGNRAPMPANSYVSARIKDTFLQGLRTEKYLSCDASYVWNYSKFRGSVTYFWTERWHGSDMTFFFDYDEFTNVTYSMTGIRTRFRGLELGATYKILPSLSVSAAATLASYQYKNNPKGTMCYDNGAVPDMENETIYIKNYKIANTPQNAFSIAANYNVKNWFFEVSGVWTGQAYVQLAPTRHTLKPYLDDLYKVCSNQEELNALVGELTKQDKLKQGWTMNASIGKMIYTKFGAINFNLSASNLLNNRGIQTSGKQELKMRIKESSSGNSLYRWGNKYYYAQGIRVYFNFGIRF